MRGRSAKSQWQTIDKQLSMPLYHQVYLVLREKIANGAFAPNEFIPSEADLMRLFSVSRITAKHALDELAANGLVVRQRGRGTRVLTHPSSEPTRANVDGLVENLIEMGLKTQVKLIHFGYTPATPSVARALQIKSGTPVQHAIRTRALEGRTFSHLTTFVPEKIGRTYTRHDLAARPLLALLERTGIRIGSADQQISAARADPQTAPLLEVEIGSPLLHIRRLVLDRAGMPVEYIIGLYRPDRYEYSMKLDRVQDSKRRTWLPAS